MWEECYEKDDFYVWVSFELKGKKGVTPTAFTSEQKLYKGKECSGDLFYSEKVAYKWDNIVAYSNEYPCIHFVMITNDIDRVEVNATISSSSVRYSEWNYFGTPVQCEGKELNKEYSITYCFFN